MGSRAGAALLEVIVAVAIMGSMAAGLTAYLAESLAAVGRVEASEWRLRDADRFLRAASLWPTADLDRRFGDREQGEWVLRVDRLTPTLYRLAIRGGLDGPELLWTIVYRREEAD